MSRGEEFNVSASAVQNISTISWIPCVHGGFVYWFGELGQKQFGNFIWEYETSITISKAINAFIRPFVETLGILIMVSTVIYFSYLGKAINEIIPIISFLALSFIRIVPSSVTLISNFKSLSMGGNALC